MATAEKAPKIYEAISNVMKDVGIVGKNDSNDFDHYKYRGIDAVMNALNPAMIKNKVFVAPNVIDAKREERAGKNGTVMMYSVLTVEYTFYTDDGSSVKATVIGEAMDRSDKSTNKAMSAAFKYACFEVFCIPTEEMEDADKESPEIGNKVKDAAAPATKASKKKEEELPGMNPPEPSDEEKDAAMKASVDKELIPEEGKVVTKSQLAKLQAELDRTGVSEQQILSAAKVSKLEEMSQVTFAAMMRRLEKTKSKG